MTTSNRTLRKACPSSRRLLGMRRAAPSVSCAAVLLGLALPAYGEEEALPPTAAASSPSSPESPAAPAAEVDSPAKAAEIEAPPESPADPTPEVDAPAETAETEAPVQDQTTGLSPAQSRALGPLSWKKVPGQGFAIGLEEGLWGGSWSQGLRITVPFSSSFAVTVRGIYLIDMVEDVLTVDAGGRLDFVGRSDVLFNVMRLYWGGGVQVIAPVSNTDGKEVQIGAGGDFGFEFFCSPYYSFFLEVGGQGGTVSPGATVLAGMMVYPWTR